jgi:hypothetical protein
MADAVVKNGTSLVKNGNTPELGMEIPVVKNGRSVVDNGNTGG